MGFFRVSTKFNPADPLSRQHELGGREVAKEKTRARLQEWRHLLDPYRYLSFLPPNHWHRY